jgi:hypothetical protein
MAVCASLASVAFYMGSPVPSVFLSARNDRLSKHLPHPVNKVENRQATAMDYQTI